MVSKFVFQFRKNEFKKTCNILKNDFSKSFFKKKRKNLFFKNRNIHTLYLDFLKESKFWNKSKTSYIRMKQILFREFIIIIINFYKYIKYLKLKYLIFKIKYSYFESQWYYHYCFLQNPWCQL
jgi:hypothetical protein